MQTTSYRRGASAASTSGAVSDIGADELAELVEEFEAAMKANVEG